MLGSQHWAQRTHSLHPSRTQTREQALLETLRQSHTDNQTLDVHWAEPTPHDEHVAHVFETDTAFAMSWLHALHNAGFSPTRVEPHLAGLIRCIQPHSLAQQHSILMLHMQAKHCTYILVNAGEYLLSRQVAPGIDDLSRALADITQLQLAELAGLDDQQRAAMEHSAEQALAPSLLNIRSEIDKIELAFASRQHGRGLDELWISCEHPLPESFIGWLSHVAERPVMWCHNQAEQAHCPHLRRAALCT